MGDGIARKDGEEDGEKTEKESRSGVQGKGGISCDPGREDALGAGRAVRRAPAPDHGLEVAALRPEGYAIGRKRVTTLMCRMGTEAL